MHDDFCKMLFSAHFFKWIHSVSHNNTELINNLIQLPPKLWKSFISRGNQNNNFNEESGSVVKTMQEWPGQWAWAALATTVWTWTQPPALTNSNSKAKQQIYALYHHPINVLRLEYTFSRPDMCPNTSDPGSNLAIRHDFISFCIFLEEPPI